VLWAILAFLVMTMRFLVSNHDDGIHQKKDKFLSGV
jgi:hypothetical protein